MVKTIGSLIIMSMIACATVHGADDQPEVSVAEMSNEFVGIWQGLLTAGGLEVRLVFNLALNDDLTWEATLDSPDQGAAGIPVGSVTTAASSIEISVPAVAGSFDGVLDSATSLIEGSWKQGGGEFPIQLARITKVETIIRPQDPERPFPYHEEEVRFVNDDAGITLAGILTIPEGDGPFPGVVLISGSGPQNRNEEIMNHRPFLVLSDHLTRNGIAVLRFDDRGVPESEGDLATATTMDFAGDVFAGVNLLMWREEIDQKAIGLIGHSEGGIIAPIVAVRHPEIAFVVLLAGPGFTGYEILLMQNAAILRASGASEPQIEEANRINAMLYDIVLSESDDLKAAKLLAEEFEKIGVPKEQIEPQVAVLISPWVRFFYAHDPRRKLEQIAVPLLALNGTLDLQVPSDENLGAIEAALRSGGASDFEVHALAGLNHLFQHAKTGLMQEYGQIEETFAPEAMTIISEWILRFGR